MRVSKERFTKRSLGRLVIDAGHLHGNNRVGQFLGLTDFRDRLRHPSQSARGMLNAGRFDKDLAIEVAQHPFRSAFGTVDRDDAEVFRSNRLNPLLDLARRLADESFFRARKFPFPGLRNHPIVS
jgi:hypothetical protein